MMNIDRFTQAAPCSRSAWAWFALDFPAWLTLDPSSLVCTSELSSKANQREKVYTSAPQLYILIQHRLRVHYLVGTFAG
jgi:hypothetical protein